MVKTETIIKIIFIADSHKNLYKFLCGVSEKIDIID